MSQFAIRAEGLSKRFSLHRGRGSLRDRAERFLRDPLHGSSQRTPSDSTLWALRNVSFEIKTGEVVGVIGHNGAGKSLLLKILSRITAPTEGRAQIRGRIAALLELGAGLHPDLTGRENVYFNAALLGMDRAEIRRQFDSIVAFSELDRFIDEQVKSYSSGMRVRLGFSVASHVQPEILVIDEALSVGDHEFQRKCLARLEEYVASGRTLLLVSHGQDIIRQYCSRVLVLENGHLVHDGDVDKALERYTHARPR